MVPEGWMTVAEAAKRLRCSPTVVYSHIRAGRLQAAIPRMMERGYLISEDELKRFASEELVPVRRCG